MHNHKITIYTNIALLYTYALKGKLLVGFKSHLYTILHGYFGEIVKLMCAQRAESVHTEQQACPATTGFRVYKSEMESNTRTCGNSHF